MLPSEKLVSLLLVPVDSLLTIGCLNWCFLRVVRMLSSQMLI